MCLIMSDGGVCVWVWEACILYIYVLRGVVWCRLVWCDEVWLGPIPCEGHHRVQSMKVVVLVGLGHCAGGVMTVPTMHELQ